MIKTTGILKFYDASRGFGFAETPHGDVRIGHEAVTGVNVADLVGGAELTLDVLFAEKGLDAVAVTSVTLTYKTGVVRWFSKSEKMGFIAQANNEEKDVFLSLAVATAGGAMPWEKLVVEYVMVKGKNGGLEASKVRFPSVVAHLASLEAKFGNGAAEPTVAAAAEESAPAPAPVEALPSFVIGETVEGVIRGYKAAKGFGFLRVEGRKDDLFVHVSKAKAIADIANGLTAICEVGENKQGFAALNVRLPGTEAPAVAVAPAKKPKLVRVPKKGKDGLPKSKGLVVEEGGAVLVDALPDNQMAEGLAKLGLVAVAADPKGLDHAASEAEHTVH